MHTGLNQRCLQEPRRASGRRRLHVLHSPFLGLQVALRSLGHMQAELSRVRLSASIRAF